MSTDARLIVSEVSVRFGGLLAADAVSFEVAPGEVVGLIGPNGAGKTTVIGVLSGTVLPTSGTVKIGATDLTYRRPYEVARSGLTRSFQHASVFGTLSVQENLLVAAQRHEKNSSISIEEIIDRLRLEDRKEIRAGDLSYGEMRRLAIGMAVLTVPRILLLDEPAAGLNAAESETLGGLIKWAATSLGCGVLLVEHDMRLVMGVSDRLLVLDHGVIIARGTPEEVRNHPEVIRVYLGREATS